MPTCIPISNFLSRWLLSAQKDPYVFCPHLSSLPQGCPWTHIGLVEHRLFRSRIVEHWLPPFSTPLSFRQSVLCCPGLSALSFSSILTLLPHQAVDRLWCLLCLPVYLPVYFTWFFFYFNVYGCLDLASISLIIMIAVFVQTRVPMCEWLVSDILQSKYHDWYTVWQIRPYWVLNPCKIEDWNSFKDYPGAASLRWGRASTAGMSLAKYYGPIMSRNNLNCCQESGHQ